MVPFKVNWLQKHPFVKEKKCSLPDYHCDNRRASEKLVALVISVFVVLILDYFFYRNMVAVMPLTFAGIYFYKNLKYRKIQKQIECLEYQFKDAILSVAAMLKAGYAIENAFSESETDMKLLYGEGSYIVEELGIIRRGLKVNTPLEILLENLAERSGSYHIEQFSQVCSIAKRSGGNIPEIIRVSADLIGKDIEARAEMKAVLSGRRIEQNIMKIMPFAIILYVGVTSKGYFDALYGNITGILIMTGCLAMYIFAFFFGDRVLEKIEREG